MIDLSIIVPVYNVEKYIHPCFESIFRQGLDESNYEVIIVNDGATDRSMEMIADIISQHDNIKVINQENQSLSVARNNGIAIAKGEYILMPDSDDLLLENSLGLLLEKALETKPDLIVADFLEMSNDEIEEFQGIIQNETTFKEKTGEQLFLEDLNPYQCYVWRTLFRKEFLIENKLSFVPGIRYQDVPFTHECYIKAKKCLRTHLILNIYRRWPGSSTLSFNQKKAMDYCVVIGKTWELTQISNLPVDVLQKIKDDVYTTFSLFMYSMLHSIKDYSSRIQIIRKLNQEAPSLNFSKGIKQKTETFLFKKMPYLYLIIRDLHWRWIHLYH
jgi:glycosyltransferase involved in cell wall biosynthesis